MPNVQRKEMTDLTEKANEKVIATKEEEANTPKMQNSFPLKQQAMMKIDKYMGVE